MTQHNYAVPLTPPTVLPVNDSDQLFPVRRVYCVGRNYAAHAIEMGGDPDRELPFFFQKNPDNIILQGEAFPYPSESSDIHFEVEMVITIGKGGSDISVGSALDHVFGYAVGLDMTRRDLQAAAKKDGRPWEIAKAFEKSAPCSAIMPSSQIGHPDAGEIYLDVNGERKQTGNLNQLIWKTPEIIAYLSKLFTLAPGDLIFTGTPAGVGPVKKGDVMQAHLETIGSLQVVVV